MKKIILSLFVFVLMLSLTSAVATINNTPNVQLTYLDTHFFNVHDYAVGHDNISTTIQFINPDNSLPVTLFGDTGGTHSNSYFSISLSTVGFVQILSNTKDLNAHPILVSVGNNYQTQDGETFLLGIDPNGNLPNNTVVFGEERRIIDLNAYFPTTLNYLSVTYKDPTKSSDANATTWIMGSNSRYWNYGKHALFGSTLTSEGKFLSVHPLKFTTSAYNAVNITVSGGGQSVTFFFNYTSGTFPITTPQLIKTIELTNRSGSLILEDYISGWISGDYDLVSAPDFCRTSNASLHNLSIVVYNDGNYNRYTILRWNNTGFTDIPSALDFGMDYISIGCSPATNGAFTSALRVNFVIPGSDTTPYNVFGNASFSQENPFTGLIPFFHNMFPEEDELTIKQKWTYTFIYMLIPWILFVIILFMSNGKVPIKLLAWCSIALDILIFFYCVAIGYVPITTILAIGLIIAVILWGIKRS